MAVPLDPLRRELLALEPDWSRRVHVGVLGPIEVTNAGRTTRLAGQRQRALLAALALEHGHTVPMDRLVDALWSANPPTSAQIKVRAHVSALRKAIGQPVRDPRGPLLTGAAGYGLCRALAEVDLTEFMTLAARASAASGQGNPAAAADLFAAALSLWRGPAFADVLSPVIRAAAVPLEERRVLAVEAKAEADLTLGRPDVVVADLSVWLVALPLRERLRGLLMLAFYRLGCRAHALGCYRDGHRLLVAELGLEPGRALRLLHQQMLSDDPVLSQMGRERQITLDAGRELAG